MFSRTYNADKCFQILPYHQEVTTMSIRTLTFLIRDRTGLETSAAQKKTVSSKCSSSWTTSAMQWIISRKKVLWNYF